MCKNKKMEIFFFKLITVSKTYFLKLLLWARAGIPKAWCECGTAATRGCSRLKM